MCCISYVTFSTAAAAAASNSWVSRHYPAVQILPALYVNQSLGCSWKMTIQYRLFGATSISYREAANLATADLFASRSISLISQTRSTRASFSHQFLNCGAKSNSCCRACWVSLFSGSSAAPISTDIRGGYGSRGGFHTAARLNGRYICASSSSSGQGEEEIRFVPLVENVVVIDRQHSEISRGTAELDNNAGEVGKTSSSSAGQGEEEEWSLGPLEENNVGISDPQESKISTWTTELSKNAVGEVEEKSSPDIWVVNFYHFVKVDDPHFEVARHTEFLEGKDVRGRIYINEQGINAQLSGPGKEATEYAEWVKEDSRFSDLLVQISPSPKGHAFPRLRFRYKPSLVQVEGGTLHLPITDPSARAVHLTPKEWTERLNSATLLAKNDTAMSQGLETPKDGHSDQTSTSVRPVVLLDVRNGYEWDVGHFKGAQRPNVDCFKSTEFGLTENEPVSSDPLANVDKEKVDVMMYCTGGIRCDVFSTMLRQKGFKNLYTLKGGVSNYLKVEGAKEWAGSLFVFDSRLAVPPKVYHTKGSTGEVTLEHENTEGVDCANIYSTETFARCRTCGDPISEPRHRNCANVDCNLLYLSCEDCIPQHKGCCSHSCSTAPKLRPLLESEQYDRWHNYRPQEPKPPPPDGYISRRAMKRRRRKERRKQLLEDTADGQHTVQILESQVSLIGSM